MLEAFYIPFPTNKETSKVELSKDTAPMCVTGAVYCLQEITLQSVLICQIDDELCVSHWPPPVCLQTPYSSMRFCRCTPPPLSHTSGTPRGSTSAPGSGRTGWWGAWRCCIPVRSTGSDSWCLWRTTGPPCPGSSVKACRSWGTLPGRPGQWCAGSGRDDGARWAPSPPWPRWWRSAPALPCHTDTSAAARCRGKATAASNMSVGHRSRRRRGTCRLFSGRSSPPETWRKEAWGGKQEKDVSSFHLIHYLSSYLGGLSGQSETVSCRVGGGLGVVVCNQRAFNSPQSNVFDIMDWGGRFRMLYFIYRTFLTWTALAIIYIFFSPMCWN